MWQFKILQIKDTPIQTNMCTQSLFRRTVVECTKNSTVLLHVLKLWTLPCIVLDCTLARCHKKPLFTTWKCICWYSSVPVGKNKLDKLGKMCSLVRIKGRVTNLRYPNIWNWCARKSDSRKAGCRSLEAPCVYDRTNAQQHQVVSSVLAVWHTCVYNKQHSIISTVSLEPPCNRENYIYFISESSWIPST